VPSAQSGREVERRAIHIARCPEHGIHGERDECFVCGGPVQKLPMVDAFTLVEAIQRTAEAMSALGVAQAAMYEARHCLTPGMRAGTAEACDALDRAQVKIKQRLAQAGLA
jgi:hypothetical protein